MTQETLKVNALGSASAGLISRILTHPLDTAKARLQAPIHPPYRGTLDVLRRTYQGEGLLALYRGFGAIVVGGTPGTVAYLCSYDYVKNVLSNTKRSGLPEFAVHFTAGMLAETFACIIYVPVDVVKERLQVQRGIGVGSMHYHGSYDAFRKIIRDEGLRGIYKGYFATLASFGPFSALYFVFYEQLKEISRARVRSSSTVDATDRIDIPFHYTVVGSASAGAAAAWLTSPLDMAKLRLQIQRGEHVLNASHSCDEKMYRGMIDCLIQIYKEKGLPGLFRGAGARVIHYVPAMTVTMTCYEEFRQLFAKLLLVEQ